MLVRCMLPLMYGSKMCNPKTIAQLKKRADCLEQMKQDLAVEQQDVAYQEVVDYLRKARQDIALKLITRRVPLNGSVSVKCCTVEGKRHLRLSWFPLLASTGAMSSPFSVEPYASGGLMLVMGDGFVDQPALSQAVGELKRWASSAQVTSTSDFCDVEEHDKKQALLVHAAEARLESKLGLLARTIADRHAQVAERAAATRAALCQRASKPRCSPDVHGLA